MLNIITKFLFKETIIENIIIFYIISVSFIIKYDNEIFFFFFFFILFYLLILEFILCKIFNLIDLNFIFNYLIKSIIIFIF